MTKNEVKAAKIGILVYLAAINGVKTEQKGDAVSFDVKVDEGTLQSVLDCCADVLTEETEVEISTA